MNSYYGQNLALHTNLVSDKQFVDYVPIFLSGYRGFMLFRLLPVFAQATSLLTIQNTHIG